MTSRGDPHDFVPRAEGDVVPRVAFWATGAVTIAVVVGSVLVARALLHAWSGPELVAPRGAPARATPQLGLVEQSLLRDTERGLDLEAQERESLRHFGWLDRERGTATIPVERAIDLAVDPAFVTRAVAPKGPPDAAPRRGGP